MYFSSIDEIGSSAVIELEFKANGYFILVAEKNVAELSKLLDKLQPANFKFFGGVFPRLIMGTNLYDSGFLFIAIPVVKSLVLHWNKTDETRQTLELNRPKPGESVFLLTDGAFPKSSSAIRKFFKGKAANIQYVGAGAGLLNFDQKPCIFDESGAYIDGAILAIIGAETQTGIKHGWTPIEGPIVANSTSENVIAELNWEPALDIYREAIERLSGRVISYDNFNDIAKSYPFGIYKAGHEYIVRDPLQLGKNGEIKCIAEVPENSTVHILHGDKESILTAAAEAAQQSVQNIQPKQAIIFDCITRCLFLEDDFIEELSAIDKVLQPFGVVGMGACVMGEICQENQSQLELFNKTVIVSSLY